MSHETKSLPAGWAEHFVLWVFRLLQKIDIFRVVYPRSFNSVLGVISFLFALIVAPWTGVRDITHINYGDLHIAEGLIILVHHIVASTFAFFFLKLTLPFLAMAQRALAVQKMGLRWATVERGDFLELLERFSAGHPISDNVKIICISGHTLFGHDAEGLDAYPLKQWAELGRLDVLMPRSSDKNPIVRARWKTYSEETKKIYTTVDSLIEEINKSKAFLRERGNQITEHDLVIVWRLVIFQNYCLVQRYLPNPDGSFSDDAPTFVYANTGKYSFYETYMEMFNAIKENLRREDSMAAHQ